MGWKYRVLTACLITVLALFLIDFLKQVNFVKVPNLSKSEGKYVFHKLGPLSKYLADPSVVTKPIRISYEDFGRKFYFFLPFKKPLPIWVKGMGFLQLMDVKIKFIKVSIPERRVGVILYLDEPVPYVGAEGRSYLKGFVNCITYKPNWDYKGGDYFLVTLDMDFDSKNWKESLECGEY